MRQRLKGYWALRWQQKEATRLKEAKREVCDNHPYLSSHFTTEDINGKKSYWCTDCFVKQYFI